MGYRSVDLDDLQEVDGPDTLTWRPLRHELGVRAFGCNAYTATAVGHDVVEPHDEADTGHEELYFVHRGCARFTVDGEEFDAAEGTYVLVDAPSHGHAVAREPATTVLSFGREPSFEPSEWEGRWLRERGV
jgi:quercetin dioxygenase-like cupin family protein